MAWGLLACDFYDRPLFSDFNIGHCSGFPGNLKGPLHVLMGNLAEALNLSFSSHNWCLGTSHLVGKPTNSPMSSCVLGDMGYVHGKSPE